MADPEAAALHGVGGVLAEQLQHRGRHVRQLHVAVAPGGGRLEQAAVDARRPEGHDAEGGRAAGRHRGQDDHCVVGRVDPLQQVAEQGVGVVEGLGPQRGTLARVGPPAVGGHPAQVRGLDHHHRAPARVPGLVEGVDHLGAVQAPAERRVAVVGEQGPADRAAGHDAIRVHDHGGRAPGVGAVGRRVVAHEALHRVGVGHHRAGHARAGQPVAQAAHLGAEGRVLVGVDGGPDGQVGDARRDLAQPPLQQLGRGDAAVGLVRVDGHRGVDPGRHRPGPGPEREVGVGAGGGAPADAGGHVGHGRLAHEPVEVGQVGGLDPVPVQAGQGHDQHAVDRRGVQLGGGRAAAGGDGQDRQPQPARERPSRPHASTSAAGTGGAGTDSRVVSAWRTRSTR